eukprot:2127876-Rhodomonas_salina.1
MRVLRGLYGARERVLDRALRLAGHVPYQPRLLPISVRCYASPTPCPVLTYRMRCTAGALVVLGLGAGGGGCPFARGVASSREESFRLPRGARLFAARVAAAAKGRGGGAPCG